MQVRSCRPNRARLSLVLLASIVPCAGRAAEPLPLDAAVQWDLIGSWAVDCQGRPSNGNPRYSYVRQGASLLIRRDTGALQDENKVISGGLTDDGGIELVTEYKAFSRVMTSRYVKDNPDQFHPVSNRDQNGVYTIQDGKLTRTGAAAPVMTRCPGTDRN